MGSGHQALVMVPPLSAARKYDAAHLEGLSDLGEFAVMTESAVHFLEEQGLITPAKQVKGASQIPMGRGDVEKANGQGNVVSKGGETGEAGVQPRENLELTQLDLSTR